MGSHEPPSYQISVDMLPSGSSVVFKESSYFSRNGPDFPLPSPAEVHANQKHKVLGRSRTTRFEYLNLLVKYGKEITIAEGQTLWALRRLLPQQVPVPEVYGWRQEGDEVFIYMELVKGFTLEEKWNSLSKESRVDVCEQLRVMLVELRKLQQDPNDRFLGHINRQPLLDIVFVYNTYSAAGPFASVKEFHDWLSALTKQGMEMHWPDPSLIPDPCRDLLPDDSLITFTHADLHPSNIMVSADEPHRVLALIDWHQSGWYPAYWEYCKTLYTADPGGEWELEYVPRFLAVAECHEAWEYYPRTLGY